VIAQILIPTDFSPAAWQATKLGMELANNHNARLNLLHIVPTVSRYSKDTKHQHLPEKLEEVKDRLNDFSKNLSEEMKVPIENFVLPGNVADTMMNFIKDHEYDLIILGVNSNGSDNELGSHTSMVIEKCGVPVLIVPNNGHSHSDVSGNHKSNGALAS
jgi:nucleotide-binding universal stress UspA family protein